SAFETGEMTSTGSGFATPLAAETSVVFPMIVGRKPVGALLVRFPNLPVSRIPVATVRAGKLSAAIIGIVLRGARALDPIRERTRQITLSDFQQERQVRAIERYRAFIDSASDGILVLDAAGRVLYLNRAAQEVTGYARDGLAGRPLAHAAAGFAGRPRPQLAPSASGAQLADAIRRSIRNEPVDNFDLELVTTSG